MEPVVSLKIKNHIPEIIYYPDESNPKKLTQVEESIYGVVVPIARRLGLIDREVEERDETILVELLDLARESDEMYITDLPEIETESLEFDLEKIMTSVLEEVLKNDTFEYEEIDMSEDVRKELILFKNKDIFSSLLDIMYTILIAKTVLAAAELGIGKIKLEDEGRNPRLMEKMAKELERLEVEMIVDPVL